MPLYKRMAATDSGTGLTSGNLYDLTFATNEVGTQYVVYKDDNGATKVLKWYKEKWQEQVTPPPMPAPTASSGQDKKDVMAITKQFLKGMK